MKKVLIYFIITLVIALVGIGIHPNINMKRRRDFLIFSFGLMILVASLRAPSVGIDLAGHYAKRFEQIVFYSWKDIPKFSAFSTYEIGYCYYCKFLSMINPNVQFYIFVTSLIVYGTMGYLIYKKSSDVILSTMLVIFSCQYYMYMNIIRQALAVSVVLIGYIFLDKSKRSIFDYIKFTLFVLVASTFHDSAILCLVMIVFDKMKFKRRDILLSGVITMICYVVYSKLFVFVANLISNDNGCYVSYMEKAGENVGNINLQSITSLILTAGAFFIGAYVLIWKNRIYTDENDTDEIMIMDKYESFLLYMGLLATVCRLLIFKMNIINRFSYYFIPYIVLLYPYAIDQIAYVPNRKIIRMAVYFSYGLYFVWMTVSFADKFYGAVPYIPFWK